MNYFYITKDPFIGEAIVSLGVRWIMVDLEYIGKYDRQSGRDTVISVHTIADIRNMRKMLASNNLLVRINPFGKHTAAEINSVIQAGADALMLPYFTDYEEVEQFIELVDRRSKIFLLLETIGAINQLDRILTIEGIDYIHIGLNDLHIERKTNFMFEFISDGSIEPIVKKIKENKIPFGIGGIAKYGQLVPPAERILNEHKRLGSSGVILSRSFLSVKDFSDRAEFVSRFGVELKKLNDYFNDLEKKDHKFFEDSQKSFSLEIANVVEAILIERENAE